MPSSQDQRKQFRLSNMFLAITWFAGVLSLMFVDRESAAVEFRLSILIVVAPFLVGLLPLAIRAREAGWKPFELGPLLATWLVFACGYSTLLILMSVAAFEPTHKTHKGSSWLYYLNDYEAGLVSVVIFAIGAGITAFVSARPEIVRKTPLCMLGIATNVVICGWYIIAILCFNFINTGERFLAVIPYCVGSMYIIIFIGLARETEINWRSRAAIAQLLGWLTALIGAIGLKVYAARHIYARLPAEPPEDCFIVSAATRGHPRIVMSRLDPHSGRRSNFQLETFRRFESWLLESHPTVHFLLRRIYNNLGPLVARQIRRPWQADLVYMALKPLELAFRLLGW